MRKIKIPTPEERKLLEKVNSLKEDNTKLNKSVLLLEEAKEGLAMENSILLESVMELTTLASQQEASNKSTEDAIMELSMFIMGGM